MEVNGKGTDIALDSADVVLTHGRLTDLSAAIRLSRKTLKNIHENLFWAFIYNTYRYDRKRIKLFDKENKVMTKTFTMTNDVRSL